MITTGASLRTTPTRGSARRQRGFAPIHWPFDATSLTIVALLALLFATAITGALRPAHVADPLEASLQGGL